MVEAIDRKNKILGKTKNPQDFTRAKARHSPVSKVGENMKTLFNYGKR